MSDPSPLIFLVAGEASGDILGARLMAALRVRTNGQVRFTGIGGPLMISAGLTSQFPMNELSLMGLAEVLPHLPRLIRRLGETVAAVRTAKPAALVTIDAPSFGLRVADRLAGSGIPRIHYVAPQVWAWRPGRARTLKQRVDHLLALLPFEPPFFTRYGLDCRFVGHPVVEGGAGQGDGARFRAKHGIPTDRKLLCVLPGSRKGEVRRLLPVYQETVALLAAGHELSVVVPTVPGVAEEVRAALAGWPAAPILVEGEAEKFDAFAASDAALAASGTVALELALSNTPSVVAYRVNALTAWAARKLITVPYVSLVNIIADAKVVPERLQEECTPALLASDLALLLDRASGAAKAQRDGFAEVKAKLGVGGPSPSEKAAEAILEIISTAQSVRR